MEFSIWLLLFSWIGFFSWIRRWWSYSHNHPVTSLEIEKIHKDAVIPKRQTSGAAGYDIHCYRGFSIQPRCRMLIPTGIKIKLPKNTYGNIKSRSGLAVKGIDVAAGTIDEDYRGELFVLLVNNSDKEFIVDNSTRIAQLLIEPVLYPIVKEVEKLDETKRGKGGFGSTGM